MNQLFDLITEIHIRPHADLQRWQVTVIESEGFFYPVDLYEDVNNAFERARLIHSYCKQPVTIKIIGENEDAVIVDCEKFSQLDIVGLTRTLYVYFNAKTSHWEIFASDGHSRFIIPGFKSEGEASNAADFVKSINPNCQVIHEKLSEVPNILDNTCRARLCKWNANDACILLPRNASLPLPSADLSFETWTEQNHPVPRSCFKYSEI